MNQNVKHTELGHPTHTHYYQCVLHRGERECEGRETTDPLRDPHLFSPGGGDSKHSTGKNPNQIVAQPMCENV